MESEGAMFRFQNFLSRKFIAFATGTGLLVAGLIDPKTWMYISFAYIGTNILQKFVEGKQNDNGGI